MLLTSQAAFHAEHAYVSLMMAVVGRALVAASETDEVIRSELSALPPGFVLQLLVRPDGPGFVAQMQASGTLTLLEAAPPRPDLRMQFKHLAHAFLVLTFQEGTARSFANNRIYVDGDVSHAIRLVRCISRMEVLILPKLIAEHAVKHYPGIALGEKITLATRIYEHVALNLVAGD